MASTCRLHIAQDSEKENPANVPVTDKTTLNGTGKLLKPFAGGVAAAASFKDRATFLNNNKNSIKNIGNNPSQGSEDGGINFNNQQKVAFRELSNAINAKMDNVFNYNDNNRKAAIKPAAALLPVEQFKTFSVYEDENDGFIETTTTTRTIGDAANAANVNKENEMYNKKLQKVKQQQLEIKTDSKIALNEISGDLAVHKYEYTASTTPMSVSDTLSPMSVDRSTLTVQSFKDDSNSNEIADTTTNIRDPLQKMPRNHRQRFYEVVEYQHDILEYFRESEKKRRPKPHYMSRQTDINNSMRTILVDWLVEVSEEYNLDTETLYLSVSYIDRFLSHMSVVRNKLQLVGTAAMYIASKYEEIYPPDVGEFVFITDDTYTKTQVLRMEQIILKILSFDLCTPTAYVYLNTYAVLTNISDRVKYLTLYICELSLLEADPYLRFYPSIISAASIALALYVCDYPIWSTELENITTYRLEDIKEVFLYLSKSHVNAETMSHHAIRDKYKAEKYNSVSTSITPILITEDQYNVIVQNYNEMQRNLIKNMENNVKASAPTHVPLNANSFFKF